MNQEVQERLASLRLDYLSVVGRPFEHFYCPILFRDEPAGLSKAHVINLAFPESERRWTIQRTDVDSFFGSLFERDFVLLAERGKHDLFDVLTNRRLSSRLRPKLLADGKPVGHYIPTGPVPASHSELAVYRDDGPPVRLALKIDPSETLSALDKTWEIGLDRDVRLPALVSLLKAAHLTLFDLIGYRYALSAAGHFVGWDVLGSFFVRNGARRRPQVLRDAAKHFPDFVSMVRPMEVAPAGFTGTISDGYLYLCTGSQGPWAFMVFVRAGSQMHAVLVPVMENPDTAERFVRFLTTTSATFEVRLARFAGERWEIAKEGRQVTWPEAKFW